MSNVIYNPSYKLLTGHTEAAILLSQIIYWQTKMKGEFYKTDSEWMEELAFTRSELETAKSKISNFVNIKRKGIPAKTYYFCEKLESLLNPVSRKPDNLLTSSQENSEPVSRKPVNCTAGKPITNNTVDYTVDYTVIKKDKEKKAKSFSAKNYIENLNLGIELTQAMMDWLEIRKAKRTPTTQKAIDLGLSTLEKLSQGNLNQKIEIINQTVERGWTGFFEVKVSPSKPYQNNYKKPEIVGYKHPEGYYSSLVPMTYI